ncbi:TIR domain-containing protein [Pseudomonas syringae]|uniref:TIR domain-containing protein n=1 Tax=Pseudomonas syringae TaxID=317 RepID=UPI0018E62BA4|nr:TIR domain-containing protein [Pseudomonas syringae]MBI6739719.1 nucleotide-binding protein [Pseudomonas syringae]MBI6744135.1 nucleotide-binding protein [Pseudomonas syringae]MBI6763157.1 nucleotide-binding protein [Pseudomonas syringae]MBI6808124.1 nucleotide-binding protein [Pseudomonas syringae]MBI6828640.1 nucleotide-binding protein [Pseudomonas syringae]
MAQGIDELGVAIERLEGYLSQSDAHSALVGLLSDAASRASEAFSGSWLGYHSRVYYRDFLPPPNGHHFSTEWGLTSSYGHGTVGDWVEYPARAIQKHIYADCGNPDFSEALKFKLDGEKLFDEIKSEVEVVLRLVLATAEDGFVQSLLEEILPMKALNQGIFIEMIRPKGQKITRDSIAAGQGAQIPTHINIAAECFDMRAGEEAVARLLPPLKKAYAYLSRRTVSDAKRALVGTNVFIGHGRSHVWRDLKDLVADRLRLPYDEFNRVPVAGVTNIARLSEMLDAAAIAFIVMTAEDEQADGTMEARTNVIHEVGLFQGRLGFARAIVLLEEGCKEFSNIQGLGQIRFPKGDIKARFEEIRQVLEREKLIAS